jgi:hypothetical protein
VNAATVNDASTDTGSGADGAQAAPVLAPVRPWDIGQELLDVRVATVAAQLALDAASLDDEVALARVVIALSELSPGTAVEDGDGEIWRRATDGRWVAEDGGRRATCGALADRAPFMVVGPGETTR